MLPIGSPCAACKLQRKKCTQDCVYAPYFPPDKLEKFLNVHKVYGASNVAKLLNEVKPSQREDAVNSLVYEAELRLIDPINGCIAVVSALQQQLQSVQSDVALATKELASLLNPYSGCLGPMMGSHSDVVASPGAASSHVGIGQQLVIIGPQNQQQSIEAHQLAAIAAKQEQDVMMRNWEHQPVIRLSGVSGSCSGSGSVCGGYEGRMIVNSSSGGGGGRGGGGEYSQAGPTLANAQPSLAVGASAFDPMAYNNQIQQHEIHEQQHQHHQEHEQQHQHQQENEQQLVEERVRKRLLQLYHTMDM
ncbi:unnamed protein product [Amaranthus hypochondriacus]